MPEQYTPTTGEVRSWWAELSKGAYRDGEPDRRRVPEGEAEFDRWLKGVQAAAWDEGRKAGEDNTGDGIASLVTGLPAPAPRMNPYREKRETDDE